MKGAVAFASVLFCLTVGLAVARLLSPSAPQVVNTTYTQQQFDSLVERRVQEKLAAIEANNDRQVQTPVTPDVKKEVVHSSPDIPVQFAKARRPLTKNERLQLAADLRLAASNEDMDLDLLDDRLTWQDDPEEE
jgi:hypothetical protein